MLDSFDARSMRGASLRFRWTGNGLLRAGAASGRGADARRPEARIGGRAHPS